MKMYMVPTFLPTLEGLKKGRWTNIETAQSYLCSSIAFFVKGKKTRSILFVFPSPTFPLFTPTKCSIQRGVQWFIGCLNFFCLRVLSYFSLLIFLLWWTWTVWIVCCVNNVCIVSKIWSRCAIIQSIVVSPALSHRFNVVGCCDTY